MSSISHPACRAPRPSSAPTPFSCCSWLLSGPSTAPPPWPLPDTLCVQDCSPESSRRAACLAAETPRRLQVIPLENGHLEGRTCLKSYFSYSCLFYEYDKKLENPNKQNLRFCCPNYWCLESCPRAAALSGSPCGWGVHMPC